MLPRLHNTKVCSDCKFFVPNHLERPNGYCRHGKSTTIDIVTGDLYHKYAYKMRIDKDMCGPDGRHYEKENNEIARIVRDTFDVYNTRMNLDNIRRFTIRFMFFWAVFRVLFAIIRS